VQLEKKDLFLLLPVAFLTLGGLGPDDPWIVGPCLALSWLFFLALCIAHKGPRKRRILAAILTTAILSSVGERRLHFNGSGTKNAARGTKGWRIGLY